MALRVSNNPLNCQLYTQSLTSTQTLSAKSAAALDQELMSTGGFSIDQLMELAGLSVSQACAYFYDSKSGAFLLMRAGSVQGPPVE
jgi:hypothetical protein